jgi:hypothetical protein
MSAVLQTIDDDTLLQQAIRRTGLVSPAELLFAHAPAARDIADRLACYLSDVPRNASSGRAIIDIAIEQALNHAFVNHSPDPAVFVQRLINAATMILNYEIRDDHDRWNPVASASLDAWLKRHPKASITVTKRAISDYRIADYRHYLASRIATTDELATLGTSIARLASAPN